MISKYTFDCPKCTKDRNTEEPEKGKDTVLEFFGHWDPTEFEVAISTYFCRKCGWVCKKIENLSTKETKYEEITFDKENS